MGANLGSTRKSATISKSSPAGRKEISLTEEDILRAAKTCPTAEVVLRALAPQAFEEEFDWLDFNRNPFRYMMVTGTGTLDLSRKLIKAADLSSYLYPDMTLSTLKQLIDHLHDKYLGWVLKTEKAGG